MSLAAWAGRNRVARVSRYRRFRAGLLAVTAQQGGLLILVDELTDGCARLDRKYAVQNRAKGAVAAAATEDAAAA